MGLATETTENFEYFVNELSVLPRWRHGATPVASVWQSSDQLILTVSVLQDHFLRTSEGQHASGSVGMAFERFAELIQWTAHKRLCLRCGQRSICQQVIKTMNCKHCGAPLQSASAMIQCPYCGGLNQAMPVVLANALRIETINEVATVMIPKWSALPAGRIDIFSTGLENQQAVSVHIVQGDSDELNQNREVGLFTFDDIAPAPRGVPRIQFTFEIARDGSLGVMAENLGTGKKITFPLMQLEILERGS